jgi:hypothetical protein
MEMFARRLTVEVKEGSSSNMLWLQYLPSCCTPSCRSSADRAGSALTFDSRVTLTSVVAMCHENGWFGYKK